MSASGLFFASFKGWYYSALLTCYFPFMIISSALIGISFSRGFSANMKAYS
jgi:hypothetical protein